MRMHSKGFPFTEPKHLFALFLIASGLMVAAYWGGLAELVGRWNKQEEYGHGYFIPLISLWLLWSRKDAIIASLGKASWSGVALILIGVSGLILGEITAIYIFIQFGFLMSLLGLVLANGGLSLLRVVFIPIAYLIFAIPLPYFIDAQLSWRLQIVSSEIGVAVLRLLGTSVFLEGNVIDLGSYKLQVVEACSGLRYLYPLLSIGFLMAYMYQSSFWKRAIIFLSAIPITVIMNSLRIAAVGLLVERWGSGMADGFLHYFEGWVIFMACLLIIVAEIWVFERFGLRRSLRTVIDLPVIQPVKAKSKQLGINYPFALSVLIVFAALVIVVTLDKREEIVPQRENLSTFPLELGSWRAQESSLSRDVEQTLGLDDYVLADYRYENQNDVNFYVAYYKSQRKGVSPHSPQVCMPGGGWVITSIDRVSVEIEKGKPFEVNRTIIEKDHQQQVVYYWFEQRGRRIASEYWMKWYLLVDALKINRTDGALVRVVTPSAQNEPIEAADARLKLFLQEAMPKLGKYVPG